MDKEQICQLAREAMGRRITTLSREVGYIYCHGVRVARISMRLAEQIHPEGKIDAQTLWAGALLHDVGKGIDPHHEIGGVVAAQILADHANAEQIETISRIVAEHNQRNRPQQCLAASRIVQDADMLDHFGPQGVRLVLGEVPERFNTLEQAVAYQLGPQADSHFKRCRNLLNFEVSREAFDRRIDAQRAFFQSLEDSEAGSL